MINNHHKDQQNNQGNHDIFKRSPREKDYGIGQGDRPYEYDLRKINESPRMGDNGSTRSNSKPKAKYPIFSFIQELHDTIQALFASGTSLSGISAMDFSESEFRMLPITIGLKLTIRGILVVFLFFIFLLISSYFSFLTQLESILTFSATASLCFFSIFFGFHRYNINSMKQYVIIDEEVSKTSRFFSIVDRSWKVVASCFFVLTTIFIMSSGLILFDSKQANEIIVVINDLLPRFMRINTISAFKSIFVVSIFSFIGVVIYVLIDFISKRKFRKKQINNNIALYSQINPSKVVDLHNMQ